MKLGIIGAVALLLGVWGLANSWWFIVDLIKGIIAFGMVVGGGLAVAIALRKIYREKQTAGEE